MEKKQRLSALFGAKVEGASPIEIREMSPALQESLKAFDLDGDGKVDSYELARAAEAYRQAQTRARRLNRMLLAGSALLLVVLAAFSGLVFTVVELTKESHVTEGTLTVKNSNETVRTSQALNQDRLCSQMSDAAWREMRYLDVTSPTGASLSFLVQGWARMPKAHSMHGTVVAIVTQIGTVTIDGSHLYFEDDVAPIFSRAGFEVATSKRSLAGAYDLFAMFNNVVVVDECGHEMAESMEPGFPTGNFVAQFTRYSLMTGAEALIARPQGTKVFDGETYAAMHIKSTYDATNGRVREDRSYPAVHDHHKQVLIETASTKFRYQVDARSGAVAFCNDESASKNADSMVSGIPDTEQMKEMDEEVALQYEGVTTCPMSGGECRKFTTVGQENNAIYDQVTKDGSYMVKEIHELQITVFHSFESVQIRNEDFTYPSCPVLAAPWTVAGTPRMPGGVPIKVRPAEDKIVTSRTKGYFAEAESPNKAIKEAKLHLALVTMGIDGHDFSNNAVNATAFGYEDLEALKAAVEAKGQELLEAGVLDTQEARYKVDKAEEERLAAEEEAHKDDEQKPAVENPLYAEVTTPSTKSKADAPSKTGRKLQGGHYYFAFGLAEFEHDFTVTFGPASFGINISSGLRCNMQIQQGEDNTTGSCNIGTGASSFLCSKDINVSIKLELQKGGSPCKVAWDDTSSQKCSAAISVVVKLGFQWPGDYDYFDDMSTVKEAFSLIFQVWCYFFLGVTVECPLAGCMGIAIWQKFGGSFSLEWNLATSSVAAKGCIFVILGCPKVEKYIGIRKWGWKFSTDKVLSIMGANLEIKIEFCVFGQKKYNSSADCHYRKTGWSLTVTVATMSCKVGRVMSAGFGGNAGVTSVKEHAMGSKQGSKYCYSNLIKYHYDNDDPLTLQPLTKSQLVITAGLDIWGKVYIRRRLQWKKSFSMTGKFSTEWETDSVKFAEDGLTAHIEGQYWSSWRNGYHWRWRAATMYDAGKITVEYNFKQGVSKSDKRWVGIDQCKDSCDHP